MLLKLLKICVSLSNDLALIHHVANSCTFIFFGAEAKYSPKKTSCSLHSDSCWNLRQSTRTTVWSLFPVLWPIIAFQSEYLLETGQRSRCVAMFPPCCLSPCVEENVPYIGTVMRCKPFIYTFSNCSVPWGCWWLSIRKQWQGKGCSDNRYLYVHWDKNTFNGVFCSGNPTWFSSTTTEIKK